MLMIIKKKTMQSIIDGLNEAADYDYSVNLGKSVFVWTLIPFFHNHFLSSKFFLIPRFLFSAWRLSIFPIPPYIYKGAKNVLVKLPAGNMTESNLMPMTGGDLREEIQGENTFGRVDTLTLIYLTSCEMSKIMISWLVAFAILPMFLPLIFTLFQLRKTQAHMIIIVNGQDRRIEDEIPILRWITVELEIGKLKTAKYNAIHRLDARNLGFVGQSEKSYRWVCQRKCLPWMER